MLSVQRGRRAGGLGSVLGSVLGVPVPSNRFPPMHDPRGGPWVLNAGDAAGSGPGRDTQHALPGASDFVDTSPPALPPMNAPGGNDPRPLDSQPRDYRAMMAEALGPRPEMSRGQKIAAIIAPMLMAASGNQAGANAFLQTMSQRRDDRARQEQEAALTAIKWGREDDLAQAKRNEPHYFSGSEDRVRFDPATGTSERVYDAPQDFEDYARARGLLPGTDGYFSAVEDFVLRGNGPTAFKYDRDLEAVRQAGRISQEAARQQNRLGLVDYRNANPPPARPRAPASRSGSPRATLPIVASPAEAMKLPPGTRFKIKGTNQVKVRP